MTKTKVARGARRARRKQLHVPLVFRRKHPGTAPKRRPSAANSRGDIVEFDYLQPGDSVGARYETSLQAVEIVMSGLPIGAVSRLQETSGLTLERIKQVAGISEGSFARRKKKNGRLSPEESERLLRVSRVFERATALYDGDQAGAIQWLETPIPSLGNRRPLDLTQTEPGAREVEDLIGRIEHGVVS